MKDKNKIVVFDTTLRDGEQSPGASMSMNEKIEIALMLQDLGVDVIEAGFAFASKTDFESIRQIGKLVKNSTIIATSDIHLKYKLQKSQ